MSKPIPNPLFVQATIGKMRGAFVEGASLVVNGVPWRIISAAEDFGGGAAIAVDLENEGGERCSTVLHAKLRESA